ncbi:MAG: ferredoxin [Candidatus Methylumidiphilus alinenensis]|uniref:Ferredoxin n=1 Tax=Candidatus Methylumidiphilus alinenensis TaxID=2202197 RepID=A0A2W4RAN4_9GAMM|nr:MAG: ferredoxin [Candidatus Methylumidiphilus alinenensis]
MPRPLKHVFVCTQRRAEGHPRGSCAQHSCDELMNAFLGEIQKRNLFDKIAVTNAGCLGPCGFGASVLVYPEGVMYGKVTKGDVTEIIEDHLLGDKPIERLKVPDFVWS